MSSREELYLIRFFLRPSNGDLKSTFEEYVRELLPEDKVILLDATKGHSQGRCLLSGRPEPNTKLDLIYQKGIVVPLLPEESLIVSTGFIDPTTNVPYSLEALRGFKHRWFDASLLEGKHSLDALKTLLKENKEISSRIAYGCIDKKRVLYLRTFAPVEEDLNKIPTYLANAEIFGTYMELETPYKIQTNNGNKNA